MVVAIPPQPSPGPSPRPTDNKAKNSSGKGVARKAYSSEMPEEQYVAEQDALEQHSLFRGCDRILLEKLTVLARKIEVAAGERVELEKLDSLVLISRGALEVAVDDGPVVTMGPGTVLNALGMLGEEHSSYNPQKETNDSRKDREKRQIPSCYAIEEYEGKAQSIFGDRDGQIGIDDVAVAVKETGLSENHRCVFNVCPHAASFDEQPPSPKSPQGAAARRFNRVGLRVQNDTLQLKAHGSPPGKMPVQACEVEDFRGGATLFLMTMKDIDSIYAKARPETGERDAIQQFEINYRSISSLRRRLLKLTSRTMFAGAPQEVTWALSEIAQPVSLDSGHEIVKEGVYGPRGDDLIVIEAGIAAVEKLVSGKKEPVAIGRLREGAIVGDECLIGAKIPRAASVSSKTRVEAIRIPSEGILQVLRRFPGVLANFTKLRLVSVALCIQAREPPRVEIAASLHLFRKLDLQVIHEIVGVRNELIYTCGEAIIEEGCSGVPLCVLMSGMCHVQVNGKGKVADVPAGNSFGESSLLGLSPVANATVRVASPFAIVMELRAHKVLEVIEAYPEAKDHFERLKAEPVEGRVKGMGFGLVRLFKRCSSEFIDLVSKGIIQCGYLPGQTLVVEDTKEEDPAMFMLTGGNVAVERAGKTISELDAGATFGELAMLGVRMDRAVTIRALTYCQAAQIPRSVFVDALEEYPEEEEYFRRCVNNPASAFGKMTWPCLQGLPQAFVNLVMLYQVEQDLPEGVQVDLLSKGNAACFVVQGRVAIMDAEGREVDMIESGMCYNTQVLLGISDHSVQNKTFVTQERCELYVLNGPLWAKVTAEFPSSAEAANTEIRKFLAARSKEKLGLSTTSCTDVLNFSAIFRVASPEFCHFFQDRLQTNVYAPGEETLPLDLQGQKMYFWLEGTAEGMDEDVNLRDVVKPGEVVGESMCLGITNYYPSQLVAKTLCVVETVDREDLEAAVANFENERLLLEELMTEAEVITPQYLQHCMQKTAPFKPVSSEFLHLLCRRLLIQIYAPGEVMVNQGDECELGKSDIFICCAGKISVEGPNGVLFGTISKGEPVGEAGAFGVAKVRTATTRAKRSGGLVCVARISGVVIAASLVSHPETVNAIVDLFKKREAMNKQIQEQRRIWVKQTAVPALSQCSLLSGCPEEFLSACALTLNEKLYQPGSVVTEIGEESPSMIIVLHGTAEIQSRTGERISFLREGASFGEVAALGLFPSRMATVRAVTLCRVIFVTHQAIKRALESPCRQELVEGFERLVETRREQVACGLPLTSLPVSAPISSVSVRTISLVSERIVLRPGEIWTPLNDQHPSGPHIGIIAVGRARLHTREQVTTSTVMTFVPGSVLLEGMLAAFDAYVRAETYCECYRIRESEFLMAIPSSSKELAMHGNDWFWRFKLYMKESCANIHRRLEAQMGMIESMTHQPKDTEILLWNATKRDSMVKARMKKDRRDGTSTASSMSRLTSSSSTSRLPALRPVGKPSAQVEFNQGIKSYPHATLLPKLKSDSRRFKGGLKDAHDSAAEIVEQIVSESSPRHQRGMTHSQSEPFVSRSSPGSDGDRRAQPAGDERRQKDDNGGRVWSRPGSVAGRVEGERRVWSAGRALPRSEVLPPADALAAN